MPPSISHHIAPIRISKFEFKNRTSLDHLHFVPQTSSPWHQKDTTRLPSLYPETTPKIRSIGHVRAHADISSNTSPASTAVAIVAHCRRQWRTPATPSRVPRISLSILLTTPMFPVPSCDHSIKTEQRRTPFLSPLFHGEIPERPELPRYVPELATHSPPLLEWFPTRIEE